MTKIYKLSGALYLAIILLTACSKDEVKFPKPVLDFITDPEIVEVGNPVTFENRSLNASKYIWNFGDGQTSTEISPTITYDESDNFTVKLMAITEDNQQDSVTRNIYVGQRVMTGLNINGIPFVNPDGNDWDDPAGQPDSTKYPDFVLVLGPQDDPSIGLATPPLTDLAPFELPIGFTLNPNADPFILTPVTWEVDFLDFDGTDINSATNSDFEVMNALTFNPVTIPTSTFDENGEGFVQISVGPYAVDLLFKIE